MENEVLSELKSNSLDKISSLGGGITWDGVKVEETGHKYSYFDVHFIQVGSEDHIYIRSWRYKRIGLEAEYDIE